MKCDCIKEIFARLLFAAQSVRLEKLRRFLDVAAGEGYELGGVDAADLYNDFFGDGAEPLLAAPAAPAPTVGRYLWQSVDGKQHDTGRVTTANGGFVASTASPEDARMIADALNVAPAPAPAAQADDPWTDLLAYVLQDDLRNRLTPRVIDIAYSAFMRALDKNPDNGGPTDWFSDTRPMVLEAIAKLRKDLMESRQQSATPAEPALNVVDLIGAYRDAVKHGSVSERADAYTALLKAYIATPADAASEADKRAEQIARQSVEEFKAAWLRVPPFADRVNKATREAITAAVINMMNLPARLDQLQIQRERQQGVERG